MFTYLGGGELAAQGLGVHPHIAPYSTGVPNGFSRGQPTPSFNVSDGIWNLGEGLRAGSNNDADYGGHLGYGGAPMEIGVELADIHDAAVVTGGPGGWQPYTWTDALTGQTHALLRFVGFLRPGQLGSGGPITDAAFELFVKDYGSGGPPAGNRFVVALGGYATTDPLSIANGGRFAYPGSLRVDGLVDNGQGAIVRGGGPSFVAYAPAGYTVLGGYIVTRIFGRPELFALQRTRELRKAVHHLLQLPSSDPRHPPGSPVLAPTADFCCIIGGGSFGSLTSQALLTLYPAEFHGGFGNVFGSGPHRVLADQSNFDFVSQVPGLQIYGGAYNVEDTLEWSTAFRYAGENLAPSGYSYFDLSPLVRRRRGELVRPLTLYEPDEDTIGHGTDFLPLISGVRDHVPQWTTTSTPVFSYTSVDRRCHDAGFYTTPVTRIPNSVSPIAAMMDVVPLAYDSWIANPNPPQLPPILTDDGSENAYAWALHRTWVADPTENDDPLVLDTAFGNAGRVAGQGLCLGLDESLRGAVIGGVPSIVVGSADGVVTRFVLESNPPNGLPPEFVVAAQSEPLAFGAHALAVGDFDWLHPGMVVAVGTKQHLFVLDAATLSLLPGRVHPLPYEFTRPRRMQVANVFDHVEYPGEELVFTSLLGHLVVLNGNSFTSMTDLGEPGIGDFVVLSSQNYGSFCGTDSAIPITLGTRGHLANITLNNVSDPLSRNPHPACLHAWTEGQQGGLADLEHVTSPSGMSVVVAAYWTEGRYNVPGQSNITSVRAFDAATLMPTSVATHGIPAELGRVEFPTNVSDGIVLDIAPVHAPGSSGALLGFVILAGQRIGWFPIGATASMGHEAGYLLDGFPPAARALALTTLDLRTRPGSEQFREEVVLSTLGGHVVWFHLEDMIAVTEPNNSGSPIDLSLPSANRPHQSSATNLPYTNRSVAGTWGLIAHDEGSGTKLFGADQSGALWEIDLLSGGVGWRGDFRNAKYYLFPTNDFIRKEVYGPIRDLVAAGSLSIPIFPGLPAFERRRFDSVPPSNQWWLETAPWQDALNDVFRPLWYQRLQISGQDVPGEVETTLPAIDGFVAIMGGGDLRDLGAGAPHGQRHMHWWGGEYDSHSNLIQGIYANGANVVESWYSTKSFSVSAPPIPTWYGRTSTVSARSTHLVGADFAGTIRWHDEVIRIEVARPDL
jgi:hypothetical protein